MSGAPGTSGHSLFVLVRFSDHRGFGFFFVFLIIILVLVIVVIRHDAAEAGDPVVEATFLLRLGIVLRDIEGG
jgi:hypothetical protein